MVNDLDPAVALYIKYLGFQVKQQAKPNFAMLSSTYSVITQSSPARRPAARPVAQADSLSAGQKSPAPGKALPCKTKQSALTVHPNIARRVLHSRRGAKILVTGATGTVGAELVKRLSERGTPARAFVRNRAQAHATALPGIEIIEGDFAKPETFTRALVGVERLFLLIPSSSQAEKQQHSLVDAAKRSGVRHIVKLSQLGADTRSLGASSAITARSRIIFSGQALLIPSCVRTCSCRACSISDPRFRRKVHYSPRPETPKSVLSMCVKSRRSPNGL